MELLVSMFHCTAALAQSKYVTLTAASRLCREAGPICVCMLLLQSSENNLNLESNLYTLYLEDTHVEPNSEAEREL